MRLHLTAAFLASVAALHLSCAGPGGSDWERPSLTPVAAGWRDAVAVQRASDQQRGVEPQPLPLPEPPRQYTYRPSDPYRATDREAAAAPMPPPPPRTGIASRVSPAELAAVTEATREQAQQPWKKAAEQVTAKLEPPELQTQLRERLDAIVPQIAQGLIDHPADQAFVTVATYREAGAGEGAAPGKQAVVAVAFEGFGREADDTFLPRVLVDMPRPPEERQAAATRPATAPASPTTPSTAPSSAALVLDPDATSYLVFSVGNEGLNAAVVPHREMKRSLLAALTAATRPGTQPAAAATEPATQPTPEELAELARRELADREREMAEWQRWNDFERERFEREMAERERYDAERRADLAAREAYDRGYDDGRWAGADPYYYDDYYYRYGWYGYRWPHYRYCGGWYAPSLIVISSHSHRHHFDHHRHRHGHHDHDGHGRSIVNRGNGHSNRSPRQPVAANNALPSGLPAPAFGRVPWSAPAGSTGVTSLRPGGVRSGTLSEMRPERARTGVPVAGAAVGREDGADGSARRAEPRQASGNDGRGTDSRSSPRRIEAAPQRTPQDRPEAVAGPSEAPAAGRAPAAAPSNDGPRTGGSRRAAPTPPPAARGEPRGSFDRAAPSPAPSPRPSYSPPPPRAAPPPSPRGGGGPSRGGPSGGGSRAESPRSSPRGDSAPSRGGGGGGGGGGGSSRGGSSGGSSRGSSDGDSGRGPRG